MPTSDRDQELLAGQVKLLFRQTPSAFIAALFNAAVVCFILWGQVSEDWLVGWGIAVGMLTAARFWLVRAYHHANPPASESAVWGRRFVICVFLSGLLWGSAGGLFFIEESHIYQMFLAFVLAGMSAGAMSTLSSYRGAYLAFLAPAVTPHALRTMAQGGEIQVAMGVMFLLFLVMMWAISQRIYRTITDTLLLRFDNADLLNKLIIAGDRQSAINRELETQIAQKERAEQDLRNANEKLEYKVRQRTDELVLTNDVLQREKELFQVTLESIGDAVITTDPDGHVTYLNPVAERFTGWSNREAQGMPLLQVFRMLNDKTQNSSGDTIEKDMDVNQGNGHGNSCILIRRNGQELAIDHTESPIRDSKGSVVGSVLTFRDVTAQRGLAQRLAHQATHDPLTGLLNRHEFERRVTNVLASAREDNSHALLYLDLDRFKAVNDTCGHTAGDELLRQVSAILQSKVRTRDILARLGGDEFGILLEHCPQAEAFRIAHSLRELVQGFRFGWQDKSFTIGVSIGLFPISRSGLAFSKAMSAADSACYAAKDSGRNQVHIYQPDDSEPLNISGLMQWLPRIQQAMDDGRLCLYFQPIVPINPKNGIGEYGEILLRLLDEQGSLILPGAFLPSAERHDQMLMIDRWVVNRCLNLLKAHTQADRQITYSINLSVQALGDGNFLDFVADKIQSTKVDPTSLCFEITENAALADMKGVLLFISALKGLGCRFSLADFGSGLASFGHLKNIPFDYLKIGGHLVKDIASDPVDKTLVEAIHRIGHVMGLKTIAEWVENADTLNLLEEMGVDYVQGFWLAKSRPINEFNDRE